MPKDVRSTPAGDRLGAGDAARVDRRSVGANPERMNIRSDVESFRGPAVAERSLANSALDDAADVFGLLADPGRLRLLVILRAGEANVGRLATRSGLSESAASHALRLLRAHQVVSVRREGRLAYYRLADQHVAHLVDSALAHAAHSELTHPERGSR